ncbi:MAG: hypothetical protein INR71_04325, partial [Terriglobus roseus]|nr:hypothetical protein [Terriglobus roseus]
MDPVSPQALQAGRPVVIVLLLTPTLSTLGLNPSFVQEFLSRLFKDVAASPNAPPATDVVVAVVDRVPVPKASFHIGANQRLERPVRWEQPNDSSEGVAYTVTQAASLDPLDSESVAGRTSGVGSAGRVRTLSLSVLGRPPAPQNLVARDGITDTYNTTLELPLASTIFQTGQDQTMVHYRFGRSSGGWDLVETRPLKSASATFDFSRDNPYYSHLIDMSADLVPITTPQQVRSGMGNVVREMSDPTDPAKTVPASLQLESGVSEFFAAKGIAPRPMSVWACIIPEAAFKRSETVADDNDAKSRIVKHGDLVHAWKQRQSVWQDHLLGVIAAGGRVAKVLSGGGGWGKKVGLLSLDSQLSFTDADEAEDGGFMSDGPAFLISADAAR